MEKKCKCGEVFMSHQGYKVHWNQQHKKISMTPEEKEWAKNSGKKAVPHSNLLKALNNPRVKAGQF